MNAVTTSNRIPPTFRVPNDRASGPPGGAVRASHEP